MPLPINKNKVRNVGIIMAGGVGSRFKANKPKQYFEINGHEMIWYSINAFKNSKNVDAIVIVLNEEEYASKNIENVYNVFTTVGGNTRNRSFFNALRYIKDNFPNCLKVVENNAACPLIDSKTIDEYFDKLNDFDYVQTTCKITDALGSYSGEPVDREDYYLIQSPDGYRFELIYKFFDENSEIGHPAFHLPKGSKGFSNFDYGINYKVTYPWDIDIISMLLKYKHH